SGPFGRWGTSTFHPRTATVRVAPPGTGEVNVCLAFNPFIWTDSAFSVAYPPPRQGQPKFWTVREEDEKFLSSPVVALTTRPHRGDSGKARPAPVPGRASPPSSDASPDTPAPAPRHRPARRARPGSSGCAPCAPC